MPDKQNPLDGIADELSSWMNGEVSYYANALKGGPGVRAPFSAETSEAQKRDYYARQMYMPNPDGSVNYDQPNPEGRSKLMARLGVKGYTDVYHTVKPRAGRQPVPEEQPEQEMGPTPIPGMGEGV